MTPEELRARLLAAAERAAVPEIDTERVRTRVRRRRGVRYAAMAGAGLAVVTAVVLNTLPSGSAPDTGTPAGSLHRQPPASGGPGPEDSSPGPGPLPRYGCGQKVTAGPGRRTVTVRVSEVRGAPDGAPRAGFTVTATAPTVLAGEPRLLVLKEGRVVAGQGAGTARRTTVAPRRPHHVGDASVPGRPCAGTTWSSVWKGGYELAVVLTPGPGASGGAGAWGAPVVARVPLRTG
ncbi:hypothetical protein [Streptomyces collinus]|uniref:hypothetical protein n=1 Tax=Streptomyces collinus TaxID=42684 RepID=UPI0036CCE0D8